MYCHFISPKIVIKRITLIIENNIGDFCLIGQFFLRLSLINFTSGPGRLEKADEEVN